MQDYQFRIADDGRTVEIVFDGFSSPVPKAKSIIEAFKASEFCKLHLDTAAVDEAVTKYTKCLEQKIAADNAGDGDSVPSAPEQLTQSIATKRASSISIEVTESKMEAYISLITAEGGENPDKQELLKQLEKKKVTYGIMDEEIDALLNEVAVADGGMEIRRLVAKGQAPGDSEGYSFEYLVTPFEDRILAPQERNDGTRDMRDLGQIETVTPGMHLVKRVKGQLGDNGHNVYGESISARIPEKPEFGIGEGTAISKQDEDILVATINGVPLKKTNGMRVCDALIVKDVDLKVGNIDYDGNVMIKGNVTPGMKVKAKGDIIIEGYVESAHVMAMGDILIKQGIIGKARQVKFDEQHKPQDVLCVHIFATGDISALYAQYAYLSAKGNINVGNQLLNSYAKAGGSVRVGKENDRRSRLVGGKVVAGRYVEAGSLGSNSFVPTEIDLSEQLLKAKKALKEAEEQLAPVQEMKQKLDLVMETLSKKASSPALTEQIAKTENTLAQTENQFKEASSNYNQAKQKYDSLKEVLHIGAWVGMYPGVQLRIVNDVFKVEKEFKRGQIKFVEDQLGYEAQ